MSGAGHQLPASAADGGSSPWRGPRLASRSEFVTVRGTRFHLRHWGANDAPLMVLVHGWMDMSATYQFLVDACRQDWHFVGIDWAGHGQSERRQSYSIYDFMVDLHFLLEHLSPGEAVPLVAHSLGGNAASLYTSVKPERIQAFINLEGYLHIPTELSVPNRLASWLESQCHPREPGSYNDRAHLAQRLRKANPRLSAPQADFLASSFGVETPQGRIALAYDTRAAYVMPITPSHAQTLELWGQISVPVLFVDGQDSRILKGFEGREAELQERFHSVRRHRHVTLPEAGHNLHHDQPVLLAQAIEQFLHELPQLPPHTALTN